MSDVGPCRPPKANRFRKGTSGNLKGRPKSRRVSSISAFDIIMDRTFTVTQDGKPRELTLEEALQHRTYQEAIKGNRPSQREVLKMIAKREKWLAARRPVSGLKLIMETEDPDNANEALLLLGVADPDTQSNDPTDKSQRLRLQDSRRARAATRTVVQEGATTGRLTMRFSVRWSRSRKKVSNVGSRQPRHFCCTLPNVGSMATALPRALQSQ